MKTLRTLAICAVGGILLASCGGKSDNAKLPGLSQSQIDSASYAFGVSIGASLKQAGVEGLNYNQLIKGLEDMAEGKQLKISEEKIGPILQTFQIKMMEGKAQQKRQEEAEFLAKNKLNEGIVETESGLQYKIIEPGNEVKPTAVDTVEVVYKGSTKDGKVFDESSRHGGTAKFPLNGVIKGWTEGLQYLGEGGKMTLYIPFDLGYGPQAIGPDAPGYSTLVFDVELIKVYKAQEKKEDNTKK